MRVITLTQPWASLVADGRKTIETRSWPISSHGRLAIHAAVGWKKADREFALECGYKPEEMVRGAVLCLVEVVGCYSTSTFNPNPSELPYGDYSPDRYAWVFDPSKLIVLPEPFVATGAQGIWNIYDERIAPSIPSGAAS